MITTWRPAWRAPRPADAPPLGRFDWLLVGGLGGAALVEGIVRSDLEWRPFVTAVAMALMPVLLWRRSRPLLAALVGFGMTGLLSVLQLSASTGDLGLHSMMAVLILVYSVVRWGSGSEVTLGLGSAVGVVVLGMYATSPPLADVLGGTVFVLLFVATGAVFRYRADIWQREQREIRNQERAALARELHDTVAHHVSAIAVQAQAGGVVAAQRPEKAAEVLATIENEASRTLAEMRSVVRALRENEDVAYNPQPGVLDLPVLARADATPAVEVTLSGLAARLPRPVDAAIYRIAQEALTNASRHARGARRVEVVVRREGDVVRLRVVDDGRADPGGRTSMGYGLRGMAERVELLGGSFWAGRGPEGGWVVEAVLPSEPPA